MLLIFAALLATSAHAATCHADAPNGDKCDSGACVDTSATSECSTCGGTDDFYNLDNTLTNGATPSATGTSGICLCTSMAASIAVADESDRTAVPLSNVTAGLTTAQLEAALVGQVVNSNKFRIASLNTDLMGTDSVPLSCHPAGAGGDSQGHLLKAQSASMGYTLTLKDPSVSGNVVTEGSGGASADLAGFSFDLSTGRVLVGVDADCGDVPTATCDAVKTWLGGFVGCNVSKWDTNLATSTTLVTTSDSSWSADDKVVVRCPSCVRIDTNVYQIHIKELVEVDTASNLIKLVRDATVGASDGISVRNSDITFESSSEGFRKCGAGAVISAQSWGSVISGTTATGQVTHKTYMSGIIAGEDYESKSSITLASAGRSLTGDTSSEREITMWKEDGSFYTASETKQVTAGSIKFTGGVTAFPWSNAATTGSYGCFGVKFSLVDVDADTDVLLTNLNHFWYPGQLILAIATDVNNASWRHGSTSAMIFDFSRFLFAKEKADGTAHTSALAAIYRWNPTTNMMYVCASKENIGAKEFAFDPSITKAAAPVPTAEDEAATSAAAGTAPVALALIVSLVFAML